MPGSARYFANQPGGLPFFRIASGFGGPTLSVWSPEGKWTRPRAMKTAGPNDPPFNATPGLFAMVESAHSIDDYVFIEFNPNAKSQGQPLPSRYFLYPGGFAYPIPAPK